MDLVIMAAGMGSRFGGLKQIEPIDKEGHFIIDYSIYDAIKAGFNKVYLIIKEENKDIFEQTLGTRLKGKIDYEFIYQDMSKVPIKCDERIKPWGTAHAIYCCKGKVKNNFAIINADDFYGYDAFFKAYKYLKEAKDNEFGMIGYKISNTLSEYGSVKRGVCVEDDGYLSKLIESKVEKVNNEIEVSPLNGDNKFKVTSVTLVSMNMFLFTPYIFDILDEEIIKYFNKHKDNLLEGEFLIPDVVFDNIKNNKIKVKVIDTDSTWYGVTYKDDLESAKASIKKLVDNGNYQGL